MVCALVALLNMVGHWFPWTICPALADKESGRLKRVYAYVHGCGTILIGLALWAMAYTELEPSGLVHIWEAWSMVVLLVVAAGAGTLLPRIVEWVRDRRHDHEDVADYEQTITGRQHPAGSA